MPKVTLQSIKCPQCGGDVPIKESGGMIRCPFCGSVINIDVEYSDKEEMHRMDVPKFMNKYVDNTLGSIIVMLLALMLLWLLVNIMMASFN